MSECTLSLQGQHKQEHEHELNVVRISTDELVVTWTMACNDEADRWEAAFCTQAAVVAALPPARPSSPSSVVVLRAEARPGRTPLWLVHPLSGSVQPYESVAACISERSVYGLRYEGTGSSLRRIAQHHVETMQHTQPSGPSLIGGHSLGAFLAWEIAHVLGDIQVGLVLFDEPPIAKRSSPVQPGCSWADVIPQLLAAPPGADYVRVFPWIHEVATDAAEWIERLRTNRDERTVWQRLFDRMAAHSVVCDGYSWPELGCPVLLFQAQEADWSQCGAHIVQVESDHFGVLDAPGTLDFLKTGFEEWIPTGLSIQFDPAEVEAALLLQGSVQHAVAV
jgi:thioesterase domain-containing protein